MRDQRVLFFGDSFVAGVGDPDGLGWVGRVVAGAHAAALPLTAYNLGIRRETSVDVASRLRAEALPRLTPDADCRLVLSFGANDATLEDGTLRTDPDEATRALIGAIADASDLAVGLLVVGPPPANDEEQRDRIAALATTFEEVCACGGVPFIDVTGALGRSLSWTTEAQAGDGAHPGAGGYAELAALVLQPFLDWLRSPPAPPKIVDRFKDTERSGL